MPHFSPLCGAVFAVAPLTALPEAATPPVRGNAKLFNFVGEVTSTVDGVAPGGASVFNEGLRVIQTGRRIMSTTYIRHNFEGFFRIL
jgi:hypothetical protein